MDFWKMNGNGNDFVVIHDMEGLSDEYLSIMAKRVCRRRRSIGADGLLVASFSHRHDFRMRIFNADGSEAEMCGNGARCMARFASEMGFADARMTFETGAGVVSAWVEGPFVWLDMGIFGEGPIWSGSVDVSERTVPADLRVIGVPHVVIYAGDPDNLNRDDMRRWGRTLRYDERFGPQGANVNFSWRIEDSSLRVVTYERGVEDLTDSCGTGSVAAALSALERFCEMTSPVIVHNAGGINRVEVDRSGRVLLGGETAVIAKGSIEAEA
ncbi:MAG: diaminopimelate epimerase [Dethiosulfovibrio peptidovorans]|nr:MAG: diaminopimelate epimerase [Dethiosulfovibrio peptidovorans]